jgi:peptidoglycan/LPS O-acetylase OafA/YrhL
MQSTLARTQHVSQSYRADIDGLRALSVIAVMLCHAGFKAFTGGFIGVDVFFTISGFVVTTSLLGDLERNAFSFKAFYARRAKRLAPALYVMLLATFVFSVLFMFPEDTFHLSKNILAVATMTSNIFLSRQTGYFDAKAADQPLLHTWSLSVEEQFYIVLPLLLFWLYRGKRKRMMPAFALLTIASCIAAVVAARHGSNGAYYFAQYRAFEFLVGTLLALHEHKREARPSWWGAVLFIAGIAMVVAGALGMSNMTQFPGIGAFLPCGGALLAMYGARRAGVVSLVLGNPVAVYLGRISYPMYLWHWPLFFALRQLDLATAAAYGYAAAIGLTFILSALTYTFVEQRIRHAKLAPRRALLLFLAIPLLVTGAMAGTGKLTQGFLFAYPAKIRADVHWSGDALFDMPRGKTCWSKVDVTPESTCMLGDAHAQNKAILWGDSHAYHLIYFFDLMGKNHQLAIHDMALTLCPPIEHEPPMPGYMPYLKDHLECVAHDKAVMAHLLAHSEIHTVFMAAAWQNYMNLGAAPNSGPSDHGFLQGQLERELGATIGKLTQAGKHVVLINDVPMIPLNLVNCAFNNDLYFAVHRQACQFDEGIAREQHAPIAEMLTRLKAQFPSIDIMHTYDVPCDGNVCKLDFDGLPAYRYDDYHHLSVAGSTLLYSHYLKRHPGELDSILAR